jgi:phage baseplate assembly protein W
MITPLARRREETYSDFFKDMSKNPVSNDLAKLIDEDSIKESLKNLILTNRGERLFQPNIGCDIQKLLFENITPDLLLLIKEVVQTTINQYEPRVALIGVDVLAETDQNSISIIITFSTINREEPTTLGISIARIR